MDMKEEEDERKDTYLLLLREEPVLLKSFQDLDVTLLARGSKELWVHDGTIYRREDEEKVNRTSSALSNNSEYQAIMRGHNFEDDASIIRMDSMQNLEVLEIMRTGPNVLLLTSAYKGYIYNKEDLFKKPTSLEIDDITSIACGKDYFTLVAANQIYTVRMKGLKPAIVRVPLKEKEADVRFTKVFSGWFHNVALTSSGDVYTWGESRQGRLGRAVDNDADKLTKLDSVEGVSSAALGFSHSVLLESNSNTIWSFGSNSCGQLGLGKDVRVSTKPTRLVIGNQGEIKVISAGAFHTACLTQLGSIFLWGDTTEKTSRQSFIYTPLKIDVWDGLGIFDIACYGADTLVLSRKSVQVLKDYFKNDNGDEERNQTEAYIADVRKLWSQSQARPSALSFRSAVKEKLESKEEQVYTDFLSAISSTNSFNICRPDDFFSSANRTNDIAELKEAIKSKKCLQAVLSTGLPPQMRGNLWFLAIGNSLRITKELFWHHREKAQKVAKAVEGKDLLRTDLDEVTQALIFGRENTIRHIRNDIERTFPKMNFFQKGGALAESLEQMLQCFVFYRPDQGYIQGTSYLAATLLLYMKPCPAFICFANILSTDFFVDLLSMDPDRQENRYRILRAVVDENAPWMNDKLERACVHPSMYFLDWGLTLFSKRLQPEVVARVWDVVLLYREEYIYIIACAILMLIVKSDMDDDVVKREVRDGPMKLTANMLFAQVSRISVSRIVRKMI